MGSVLWLPLLREGKPSAPGWQSGRRTGGGSAGLSRAAASCRERGEGRSGLCPCAAAPQRPARGSARSACSSVAPSGRSNSSATAPLLRSGDNSGAAHRHPPSTCPPAGPVTLGLRKAVLPAGPSPLPAAPQPLARAPSERPETGQLHARHPSPFRIRAEGTERPLSHRDGPCPAGRGRGRATPPRPAAARVAPHSRRLLLSGLPTAAGGRGRGAATNQAAAPPPPPRRRHSRPERAGRAQAARALRRSLGGRSGRASRGGSRFQGVAAGTWRQPLGGRGGVPGRCCAWLWPRCSALRRAVSARGGARERRETAGAAVAPEVRCGIA